VTGSAAFRTGWLQVAAATPAGPRGQLKRTLHEQVDGDQAVLDGGKTGNGIAGWR
jgi:hypothetical protein